MQAMIALIKREYLEHRGAFLVGPSILIGLMLLGALYAAATRDFSGGIDGNVPSAMRFYELAFAMASAAWLLYLMIMLFFYYADAFSADSRNNSMLFWKSMPQSDAKILGTKVAASLTAFPAVILVALAITGVIAYLPALIVGNVLTSYAPPTLVETVIAWLNVMMSAITLYALTLLWYLPFLAWVGFLSTIFKRWSIPLAILIPAIASAFEKLVLGGRVFNRGYIWGFLSDRFELKFEGLDFEVYWLAGNSWNGIELTTRMLAGTDWISLIGGLAVAVILVYAASEYRRRYVLT